MAKKKRNKKYRYTTGGRVDMRTGGRVQAREGGFFPDNEMLKNIKRGTEDGNQNQQNRFEDDYNPGQDNQGSTAPQMPRTPFSNVRESEVSQAQLEREQRLQEAGERTAQIARGETGLPQGAEAQATLMGAQQPQETQQQFEQRVKAEQIQARPEMFVQPATPVQVQQVQDSQREVAQAAPATQVELPEEAQVQAAKIKPEDVVKLPETAVVKAAQGEVSPDVTQILSDAAGIQEVQPIEAAKVEIPEGALAERVVGKISPESMAQAAQVAGTTLARVTRAKKQLSNAGLTSEQITELGNDPEALEARLMDLTEAERGIIEGLPEEALVSNQLNSLLQGIEDGEIPAWARPAIASVEQVLAQRGMSASTVGRDALFNAIITSAVPLAQSNAQAIQQSVTQQKTIESQAELANSKFLQTVALTEANLEQQATIQQASLMAQRNLAEADQNTKLGIANAQAFLQMDMANLSNEQQSYVLKAQQEQQRMLSNQAAANAATQFNATSENQVNQFMAQLATNVELNNAQRMDAMNQFNTTQQNQALAQEFQSQVEIDKFNSQLAAQTAQFNAQQDFARQQFNAQNSLVIEQSNVQWRREITKADTAIQNQINMQNAQNTFAMSQAAQAQLWQELRDEFDFIFKASENAQNRKTNIAVAGMQGGEGAAYKRDSWLNNLEKIINMDTGGG